MGSFRKKKKSIAQLSLNFREAKKSSVSSRKYSDFQPDIHLMFSNKKNDQNISYKPTESNTSIEAFINGLRIFLYQDSSNKPQAPSNETNYLENESIQDSSFTNITLKALLVKKDWSEIHRNLSRKVSQQVDLDMIISKVCDDVIQREEYFTLNQEHRSCALKLISLLIFKGANPNFEDSQGRSLLWRIAEENEIDFLRNLILTKCDRQELGIIANPNNSVNLKFDSDTRAELGFRDDDNEAKIWSLWHIAVEKNSIDMLKLFINCELQTLLFCLDNHIHYESIRICALWQKHGNPLILAISQAQNEADCLRFIEVLTQEVPINQDADMFVTFFDPNSTNLQNQTAMHLACKKGFLSVVSKLLTYCQKLPNKETKVINLNIQEKACGLTPLMYAITFSYVEVCRVLLANNSDISMTNNPKLKQDINLVSHIDEQNSLHLACSNEMELDEIVSLLCKNKIRVNAIDKFGFTGLLIAVLHGHISIVSILLQYNANVLLRTKLGKETALHIASACGYINIVALLLKNGAEVHGEDRYGRTALHHAFEMLSRLTKLRLIVKQRRKLTLNSTSFPDNLLKFPEKFGFTRHPKFNKSEHLKTLSQNMKLIDIEIASQNMVIKLLLEKGANLEHEDEYGETAFITSARQLYFKNNRKQLMEIVNHPMELGYTHEMFIDKRTQASVKTMYIKSGSKFIAIKDLIIWIIYTILITSIAVQYTGRGYFHTLGLRDLILEKFAYEEFDAVEIKSLFDVMNFDDWNDYFNNVLSQTLSTKEIYTASTYDTMIKTNINGASSSAFYVGAPRLRLNFEREICYTLESNMFKTSSSDTSCFWKGDNFIAKYCPGLKDFQQVPITQNNMYQELVKNMIATTARHKNKIFKDFSPNKQFIVYRSSAWVETSESLNNHTVYDMKDFLLLQSTNFPLHIWGNYDYHKSHDNFFSVNLPLDKTRLETLNSVFISCGLFERQLKLMSIDVSVYSPQLDLFAVTNIFVEQSLSGHIRGDIRIHTYKLLTYHTPQDYKRLILEVLFLLMSINYISSELSALFFEDWDKKYTEESCTPRYWSLQVMKEEKAIFHAVEDPHSFRVLLTSPIPGFRRCLVFYKTNKTISPYLVNIFNYIDLLIIILIVILLITQVICVIRQNEFLLIYNNLPTEKRMTEYIHIIPLLRIVMYRQYLLAIIVFLCYIKILEFIQISNIFAIPVIVIGGMITQLMSFFIIFMIFILAFTLLKFTLYGNILSSFRTSFEALISTFRSALGEIQFDQMSETDHSFGYLIGIVVAFILVILLLNLLIAIMNEAYDEVKSTAEARWCYMQFRMILRNEQQTGRDKFSILSQFLNRCSRYMNSSYPYDKAYDLNSRDTLWKELDETAYLKEFGSDKSFAVGQGNKKQSVRIQSNSKVFPDPPNK